MRAERTSARRFSRVFNERGFHVLAQTENQILTQVGPGTPAGELLRRYWHPIAPVQELEDAPLRTKEVRILGEDLVLYRDRSGQFGLLDRSCAHRRVNLAVGVVEQDGLRCQYHGWKFDRTGRCVEQPFEDTLHPEALFREKCGIKAYPVQEQAGLVWAYLGPQPAPVLPLWEPLAAANVVRDIAVAELPCNWLQCQENSLDPVHVEWLHKYFGEYALGVFGGTLAPVLGRGSMRHIKIGFDAFEHGIIKRRVLEGGSEESDEWKHGHPAIFPNMLYVGNQFAGTLQFRVPVDDRNTYHVSLYTFRAAPGTQAPEQPLVPYRYVPLTSDGKHWELRYVFNQDYMAWVSQGEIAERDLEKLGESDRGIILFRQMLKEQLGRVERGEDPMNVFRDQAIASCVNLPVERIKFGATKIPTYVPTEAGYSADAEKINAVLGSWSGWPGEPLGAHSGVQEATPARLLSLADTDVVLT